ncbi:zinc-binding dehydrogenase [Pseudomonas taiwanensis]|uniref:Zinc-binding dehydrogenase n=1 Tax=Pseudomonas taiwanensis TaxID=470150 RepID=A0ABR6VBZ1_9PSED|nr:zinc-binding dehydrogenase [Pseudomonas taiwanensis]MBC3478031.1 zinc-binding dehydrogenase [Pseudomonas taiwanensis]
MKKPEGLSDIEVAALWMSYLTPNGVLVEVATARPGDWVLITAASSIVGIAALQIARQLGGHAIVTTLTSDKKAAILNAGAEAVIATQDEPLAARLLEVSGGGINIAFDPVGGPLVTLLSRVVVGNVINHGCLSNEPTLLPLKLALRKGLFFSGYVYTGVTKSKERLGRAKGFLEQGVRDGNIRPLVDKIFPLSYVVEAHRYLGEGKHLGKIIIAT